MAGVPPERPKKPAEGKRFWGNYRHKTGSYKSKKGKTYNVRGGKGVDVKGKKKAKHDLS